MKKVLYGTTALVAGVAFAGTAYGQAIELSIGGKQEVMFGVGSVWTQNNANQLGNTGMSTDTELYFTGSTTLDNGITVQAIIQLEAEDNGDRNADEQAIIFSGGFGALQLGQRQTLAGAMAYGAPTAGGGLITNTEYWAWTFAQEWDNLYTSDDLSVSYVTPSFFGFTLAAGYAPEDVGRDDGANTTGGSYQFWRAGASSGSYNDIVSAGLAFDNEFSGIGLHADFGYMHRSGVSATAGTITGIANAVGGAITVAPNAAPPDEHLFRGGASVSYMGFEVGGSYGYWDRDANDADLQSWKAGASYQNGPYGVAFVYDHFQAENGSNGWGLQFSGNYILAPGIDLGAAVFHNDAEPSGPNNNSSTTGGIMGVGLSF
jgi:outer membrane protein OmpU